MIVDVNDTPQNILQLIELVESGSEDSGIISRANRPIVRIVASLEPDVSCRFGIAKGKFKDPSHFEEYDSEIAAMFGGEP